MGGRGEFYSKYYLCIQKECCFVLLPFQKETGLWKQRTVIVLLSHVAPTVPAHFKIGVQMMLFIKSTFPARFCFMCVCSFVRLLTFPWLRNHSFWYSWRIWILKSDQQEILWTWEAASQCCKIKHVVHWYHLLYVVLILQRGKAGVRVELTE